ncbi:MAG: copper transporter [Dethiobacteria bacterium]
MDQQNHFFSLIAVFLALGIGILIGASMGENALIHNQIAIIESLRSEIVRYKDEVNTYFSSLTLLEEELLRWETLEVNYLTPLLLEDKLANHAVKVIALEEMPGELLDFLELTGAAYHIYIFDEEFSGEESVLLHTFAGEEFSINNKAELYNILGNELALPPGTCLEAAGDSILDILREKELLEIVSNNKASNEESIPPPNGCRRELFIAGSFPGELVDHLVKMVGIEGVIIWQDFINGINGITGTENDPATFAGHGAGSFFSKLKLLELINNSCNSA